MMCGNRQAEAGEACPCPRIASAARPQRLRQGSTTPRRETEENQTAHVIAFMRTRRGAPAAGPQDPRRAAQVNNVQRPGATRRPPLSSSTAVTFPSTWLPPASLSARAPLSLPRRLRSPCHASPTRGPDSLVTPPVIGIASRTGGSCGSRSRI